MLASSTLSFFLSDGVMVALYDILVPLSYLACATAMAYRCRGSIAGILGPIGFGLIFLVHFLFSEFAYDYFGIAGSQDTYDVIQCAEYLGLLCAVAALFLIPRSSPGLASSSPREQAASGNDEHDEVSFFYANASKVPPPDWRLAKWWIACSSLSFILGVVYLVLHESAGSSISDREMRTMTRVIIPMVLTGIPATVLFCLWLYQSWKAVPKRFRTVSPGQAVGFLFIPIFNFYWLFRAVPGLSNAIWRATTSVAPEPKSRSGLGIGVCAAVVTLIPYLNLLSWLLYVRWVFVANDARNRMVSQLIRRGPANAPTQAPAPQ